jgi:DNA-binding response OmpR family regulator
MRAAKITDIIAPVRENAVLQFHGFAVDRGRRIVSRRGMPLHVTRKAFDVLLFLIERAPQVVSKADLHQELWTEPVRLNDSDAIQIGSTVLVFRVGHLAMTTETAINQEPLP